jgi:hypothetical protein
MINLIPPTARRSVIREYWLRVISVWLFLLGTGFLIVATLLLPTYMIILIQKGETVDNAKSSSETAATYDGLAAELSDGTELARVLLSSPSTTPLSQYIQTIEAQSGDAVAVNSYVYKMDTSGEGVITISGIADTRQALAGFRDVLSNDSHFSNVELPISNLIKERDLLFSIQLLLATSTSDI